MSVTSTLLPVTAPVSPVQARTLLDRYRAAVEAERELLDRVACYPESWQGLAFERELARREREAARTALDLAAEALAETVAAG